MDCINQMTDSHSANNVKLVSFPDVCQYVRGLTYNKAQEVDTNATGAHKVLRANNITLGSNALNFEDIKCVSKDVPVKDSQWLKQGDILMCASSGSQEHVGKVAFITEDINYTFGGFMAVIRCSEKVIPQYMFYILSSGLFTRHLKETLKSNTIKTINASAMNSFQFPLPSLDAQRKIVEILSQYLSKNILLIDTLQKELHFRKTQYEHYRELLFHSKLTPETPILTLAEISKKVSSGGTPKKAHADYYDGGTIPWLRTQEVWFNEIYETEEYITEKGLANSSAKWIPQNCVIIAISGASAARCAINKIALTTNQHCCNFEIDESKAFYEYVFHWISSQYLKLKALGRGAREDLNADIIKSFFIPIPPIKSQIEIVNELNAYKILQTDLEASLQKEIKLRQIQYEFYRDKLLAFTEAD